MATLTKSAGSGSSVDRDGKSSWSNAGYVTTADSSYASVSISKSSYSSWLYASNFSFGIPDDSIITGIVATIKKYGNSASSVKDSVVQLCNDSGTLIGSNQATSTAWPSSSSNTTYGSSTSLWGVSSLKGSDVNAAGFGVKLSAANSDSRSSNSAYVDYVSLTITYTPIYTGICSDGIGSGEGLSSVGNFTNVLTDVLKGGDPLTGGIAYLNAAADAGLLSDAVAHAWLQQLVEAGKLSDSASVELLMGGFAKKIQFGADMPGYGLIKFPIRIDRNDADSVIILDGSSDKG